MKHYSDQDFVNRVGKKIAATRKLKNLTQEDIIERTGLSLSQIGRIERGEINTTISMISLIANSIGIHPSKLLDVEFELTPEYIKALPSKNDK